MKHLLEILKPKIVIQMFHVTHTFKRLSSSHNPASEVSSSLSFVNKSSWTFPRFISRQRQPADCSISACQAWSFKHPAKIRQDLPSMKGRKKMLLWSSEGKKNRQ